MTDSIMAIAVSVLVPLCAYLAGLLFQAKERCRQANLRADMIDGLYEQLRKHMKADQERAGKLFQALMYYARAEQWQSEAGKHSAAYRDKGQIARKALGGEQ